MRMMLSFSRREKMSYARSPRLVCSTTIGTSCIRKSLLPGTCWRIVKLCARSLIDRGKLAERGSWLCLCNCSMPHEEVNRLLPTQSRRHPRKSAFLFKRRTHGGRRAARALGVAADLLLDLVRRGVDVLAPRHFVEINRARHRLLRHLALALAEGLPVDAGLTRVDVLLHQSAREILEPTIELAFDERRRQLEGHAL